MENKPNDIHISDNDNEEITIEDLKPENNLINNKINTDNIIENKNQNNAEAKSLNYEDFLEEFKKCLSDISLLEGFEKKYNAIFVFPQNEKEKSYLYSQIINIIVRNKLVSFKEFKEYKDTEIIEYKQDEIIQTINQDERFNNINSNELIPILWTLYYTPLLINNKEKEKDKRNKTQDNDNIKILTKKLLDISSILKADLYKLNNSDDSDKSSRSDTVISNTVSQLRDIYNKLSEINPLLELQEQNKDIIQDIKPTTTVVSIEYKKQLYRILDQLIYNILFDSKFSSNKENMVNIPLLQYNKAQSAVLSLKIIILYLISYYSNKQKQGFVFPFDHRQFSSLLNILSEILFYEGNLFGKKFNSEIYENEFSDFEYNNDNNKDVRRKEISYKEFEVYRILFYPFLTFISKIILHVDFISCSNKNNTNNTSKDGFNANSKKNSSIALFNKRNYNCFYYSFKEQIEEARSSLKKKEERENNNKTDSNNNNDNYNNDNDISNAHSEVKSKLTDFNDTTKNLSNKITSYLIFIFDLLNFIYSTTQYLDKSFNEREAYSINITDIYSLDSISNKIKPLDFPLFFNHLFYELFTTLLGKNSIHLINRFLYITDFRSDNENIYSYLQSKNDSNYYIYEQFNTIGFAVACSEFYNNRSTFLSYSLSNATILNTYLPLISALIKREQNFKYLGLELLINIFKNINYLEIDIKRITNYSMIDVVNDLFAFVGGPEPEIKRSRVVKFLSDSFFNKFNSESLELILNEIIIEALNPDNTAPEGGIKDKELSFVINLIKSMIIQSMKTSNAILLSKGFIHRLVCRITSFQEVFFLDIIEILSSAISFLHYLIVLDKTSFKGGLGFYSKDYLNRKMSEMNELHKIVQSWINKKDSEKLEFIEKTYYKNTGLKTETLGNVSNKKEMDMEHEKSVNQYNNLLRKHQTLICQNLITHIDSLISKSLKEISESN